MVDSVAPLLHTTIKIWPRFNGLYQLISEVRKFQLKNPTRIDGHDVWIGDELSSIYLDFSFGLRLSGLHTSFR